MRPGAQQRHELHRAQQPMMSQTGSSYDLRETGLVITEKLPLLSDLVSLTLSFSPDGILLILGHLASGTSSHSRSGKLVGLSEDLEGSLSPSLS